MCLHPCGLPAERDRDLQHSEKEAKARATALDKQAAQLAVRQQEVEQQQQRLQQREEVSGGRSVCHPGASQPARSASHEHAAHRPCM
jgi:hypothetical protein